MQSEDRKRWQIDKHIPVAVIMAGVLGILAQTGTIAWMMSKYDSRISGLESADIERRISEKEISGRIRSLETGQAVMHQQFQAVANATQRIESKLDRLVEGRE